MIDTLNIAHYPLLAGLHCQPALTGRIVKCIENLFFDVGTPVPLFCCGRTEGGRLVRAGSLLSVCQPTFVLPP
jgi:hypothetical protein